MTAWASCPWDEHRKEHIRLDDWWQDEGDPSIPPLKNAPVSGGECCRHGTGRTAAALFVVLCRTVHFQLFGSR
jgi:hypothetical protein